MHHQNMSELFIVKQSCEFLDTKATREQRMHLFCAQQKIRNHIRHLHLSHPILSHCNFVSEEKRQKQLEQLIRKLLQYLWNSYGTLGLGNIRYCVSLNTLHVTICFD